MKAILTLDLQEDNGTSVFKASETKPNFVQIDFDKVITFITSPDVRACVEYMCWMAGGTVPKTPNGTTTTFTQLKVS